MDEKNPYAVSGGRPPLRHGPLFVESGAESNTADRIMRRTWIIGGAFGFSIGLMALMYLGPTAHPFSRAFAVLFMSALGGFILLAPIGALLATPATRPFAGAAAAAGIGSTLMLWILASGLIAVMVGGAMFLCTAIVALVLTYRLPPAAGQCAECGYSLEGLRDLRCPECGTRFRGQTNVRSAPQRTPQGGHQSDRP